MNNRVDMLPKQIFQISILVFHILLISACSRAGNDQSSGNEVSSENESIAPFGLDASRLTRGKAVSEMAIVQGDERRVLGTATQEVATASIDGRAAIRFVLIQELTMGTMYDTLFVDRDLLLPIRYSNKMGAMQTIDMRYSADGRVRSEVVRGDMRTGIDTTITGPHLDGAEFAMLIPALPLAADYSAEIPVVDYESGASSNVVSVVGSKDVEYAGTTRSAWQVEVESPQLVTRYLIDKESRMVYRVDVDLGSGNRFEQILQ